MEEIIFLKKERKMLSTFVVSSDIVNISANQI